MHVLVLTPFGPGIIIFARFIKDFGIPGIHLGERLLKKTADPPCRLDPPPILRFSKNLRNIRAAGPLMHVLVMTPFGPGIIVFARFYKIFWHFDLLEFWHFDMLAFWSLWLVTLAGQWRSASLVHLCAWDVGCVTRDERSSP